MAAKISKQLRVLIRTCFETAETLQPGPHNLKGRGHDRRVSVSRQLAAILRGAKLTRIHLPGYGANHWYPELVAIAAARLLREQLGKEVVCFYGTSAYLDLSDHTDRQVPLQTPEPALIP